MTSNGTGGVGTSSAGGSGLTPNISSLLCYLLMAVTCGVPVAGIIFLVIEKTNLDVRFHAWQSLLLGSSWWGVYLMLNGLRTMLPFFGVVFYLLSLLVSLGGLALWIICMIKSYQGERWRIPLVGDFAAKQTGV